MSVAITLPGCLARYLLQTLEKLLLNDLKHPTFRHRRIWVVWTDRYKRWTLFAWASSIRGMGCMPILTEQYRSEWWDLLQ